MRFETDSTTIDDATGGVPCGRMKITADQGGRHLAYDAQQAYKHQPSEVQQASLPMKRAYRK